jgi:hypothetical protein
MFFVFSCNKETILPPPTFNGVDSLLIYGTSDFIFTEYTPLGNKPMKVYFYIPNNAYKYTPILFVLHGNDRDALYSRNELITIANQLKFIVVAPEFSETNFPGGDGYNLGNIFVDGDNPTLQTLNNENIWSFSIIEPIFENLKNKIGSNVSKFDIFGHSAGGQFVQRFLLYKPNTKINKAIIASAGWYTMLDNSIAFPYGTKSSPAETFSYNTLFSKKVFVVIGGNDTNPNSDALRHNDIVDKQGLNRLERAQYFYTQTRNIATKNNLIFNWDYSVLPKVDHDFSATAAAGANLLYK